jgi:pre-rRNA-processing protein TSR2
MAGQFSSAEEARQSVFGQPGERSCRFIDGAEAAKAFVEAARALLRRWTALGLAVANQWGGPESESKAEQLLEETLQLFEAHGSHVSHSYLSQLLAEAMSDDFCVQLEDDSDQQLASELIALHSDCLSNSLSKAQDVLQRDFSSNHAPPGLALSRADPDENNNEDNDAIDDTQDTQWRAANTPDTGDKTAAAMNNQIRHDVGMEGPVPDEDGFMPVVRSQNRKKR